MSTDLELIEQLEKELGFKLYKLLKQCKFDEIDDYSKHGFAVDENGNVTGLNIDKIKSVPLAVTLSKFRHLRKLRLSDTGLTDISFLQGLSNLSTLYLSGNRITDISFLRGLSNLTKLYLYNNHLTDISYLQGLSNLMSLSLSHNQLTDIPFLNGLSNLTTLELGYNHLTDISFF